MRAAVVGGGVVGAALALALARRGAETVLLEAEAELASAASGTNSGILHTGFDSVPGELETELILRSATLREEVLDALGVPVLRCGAVMRDPPPELPRNGVAAHRNGDGSLLVPGEWITDPVAFTHALAGAAERHGAEIRLSTPVTDRLEDFDVVANCAGLHADEVARRFGDDSFEIRPRKGEFFVFDVPLERILLPTPTPRTKGVLVFPTLDGRCVAGPTAVDVDDKADWSVRPEAREEVLGSAVAMHPPLEGAEPVASYAGLRPAGRGVNYLIGRSAADPRLVNVAAIRSTGLSAALGIAERVAELVVPGAEVAPLRPGPPPPSRPDWWRRP
jgi:glycerol-3-phosphate dehydrogenase